MIREVIRTGQVVETEDSIQVVGLDKARETVIFEETLEDMEDKIIGEDIEMTDILIIMEAVIDQEKRHSQEIMVVVEIEIQVTVDQGQDLELVQIEIG